MTFKAFAGVFALAFAAACAQAAVVDSSASGFTLKISLTVQASPHEVYTKLLHPAEWWANEHTFSGNAHNLLPLDSDARTGCFCEKMANGGSVRHLDVVRVEPDKMLVLRGGLGPMMNMGVQSAMTIALAPEGSGTKLEVTFALGGYSPSGLNTLAPVVDNVLTAQFTKLKQVAEPHK